MSRRYQIPDADMFQQSRVVREFFILDKPAFISKVPTFADPYAADWLASIVDSESYETDEVRTDLQMQETAEVLAQMAQSRKTFNTARLYVKIAFGSNQAILNRFGFNDYDKAANTQQNMVVFLRNLHKQCNAESAALIAAGWNAGEIADIKTLADTLAKDNTDQNQMIQSSSVATRDRIDQHNSTFEFWEKVNQASKVVFYDDPVKLNLYNLPEGPQPDPDINLKGKVIDSTGGAPLKNVAVKVKELDIEAVTNYAGNYNFVSIPAGTYTLAFELTGYAVQEIPVTILASGVVVQNVSLVVL